MTSSYRQNASEKMVSFGRSCQISYNATAPTAMTKSFPKLTSKCRHTSPIDSGRTTHRSPPTNDARQTFSDISRHSSKFVTFKPSSRVVSDKTTDEESTSLLAGHLERFHRLVAAVNADQLTLVKERLVIIRYGSWHAVSRTSAL